MTVSRITASTEAEFDSQARQAESGPHDDVASPGMLEGAEALELFEVPPMTVQIAGHHELPVVGEHEQRTREQRVVSGESGGLEKHLGRTGGIAHPFCPALAGPASSVVNGSDIPAPRGSAEDTCLARTLSRYFRQRF